jgi:hypothetical protein
MIALVRSRAIPIVAALAAASCGTALMKLPSGPGTPASDAGGIVSDATAACRRVSTITAEVGVSGSVGGRRMRGRLSAGLAAPASARLEAVAPFGQPVFIFVAVGSEATLLLPRDGRVLEHGRPAAVLEAVAGVPLGAAELRAVMTGCAVAPRADAARALGADWRVVPDEANDLYIRRDQAAAPWRLVATVHRPDSTGAWRAEYREFQAGLPHVIHLASADSRRFDLTLQMSQVEINTPLGADVFRVQIPRGADPITLAELRQSGPLRANER